MNQFGYYNQNYLYANVPNSRVYINPNFNRNGMNANVIPVSNHNNNMYFNPNFSKVASSQHNAIQQRNDTIRPKIHVNPNFFKPKTQNQMVVSNNSYSAMNPLPSISIPVNSHQLETKKLQEPENGTQVNTGNPISTSRYCLVRKKENKSASGLTANIVTNTVKVNKYKSISLNTVKKDLASDRISSNNITENSYNYHNLKSKSKCKIGLKLNNAQNTRFKFVKRNSATILNLSEIKLNAKRRTSLLSYKGILKTNTLQTKKIIKSTLKKNNVPCPLYKKYGKCLRLSRGNCHFLHDKKHVAICRKFMKGICHDEQCLLSHDLTDKKMPTCYFYLQGICTKEGCPYLHVKLNEKTKICQDFLKGYCEKGDKCLYRHVNITSQTFKVSTKKINSDSQTTKRVSVEKAKSRRKTTGNRNSISVVQGIKKDDEVKEHRYFKDLTSDAKPEEQYSVIKPTRCKLGTLPSFIQL